MKRKALALVLVMALSASVVAGMQTLGVARANFLPAPAVIISSPASIIYSNTSIPLRVAVNILSNSPEIVQVLYCLDENSNVTLTNLTRHDNEGFSPGRWGSIFIVTSILENLAEGNHTLKVYSRDAAGKEMSSSVEFTIDTKYRYPEVIILSPQNKTYTTTEVPLTWTCDEQIVTADYELDLWFQGTLYLATVPGTIAPTVPGNTTLTGLSNGTHTITIHVDTARGPAYKTVYFTVSPEKQPQPEPFPTVPVSVASVIIVVVMGSGLFFYFKKRRSSGEHI